MPYSLVLADPSPTVQKVVHLAFPEPEFRVEVFEDGRTLLDAAPGLRPDAVLVDVDLPETGGLEAARALKARPELRAVPLLFLKGTFAAAEPERLAAVDHRGVVQKPFDSGKLAGLVRDLIDRETSPATLPEEPDLRPASAAAAPRSAAPEAPGPDADGPSAGVEDVRREVVAAVREIEKRVRARVFTDLKDYVDSRLGDAEAGPEPPARRP